MIGNNDGARSYRTVMLEAAHFHAIEQSQYLTTNALEELLGQEKDAKRGRQRIQPRYNKKQGRNLQLEAKNNHGQDRGCSHEQGVDNIIGGDDASTPRWGGTMLHQRIQGNDIDA